MVYGASGDNKGSSAPATHLKKKGYPETTKAPFKKHTSLPKMIPP